MKRRESTSALSLIFCLSMMLMMLRPSSSAVVEDDVKCLRGVQQSLSGPQGGLSSWNFGNTSAGFICSFSGVFCWNDHENRVIRLQLPSMSLSGQIPSSLQFCSSMTNLDLSSNSLSGPIPSSICDWLPYLVTLDLSSNSLSGPIPPELSNCKYLNTLTLDGNSLSGEIPNSLSHLDRLKSVSVANNKLSGPIPPFFAATGFDSSSFDGNSGLCGRPLGKCGGGGGLGKTGLIIIVAAGVFGAAASLLFAFALWWWFFRRSSRHRRGGAGKRRTGAGGEGWVERLRSHRYTQVSLFQKPIVKVRLADLMAATNDFDPENVIECGGSVSGVCYKAVLSDGSALAVKRLRRSWVGISEKQFRAEMGRLGQLRHPNLVPLLGFCIAVEDERLLVYKHMPSGSLASLLHGSGRLTPLDWPSRLRIGVGAARGLAWLHHTCQPPFLHQSMSSSTVLLDEDYEARIIDFGLACLSRRRPVESNGVGDSSAMSSALINGDLGELGYIAPEYSSNPVVTAKGDVYAFGVVLLELATGQKPLEVIGNADEGFKGNLVDWFNWLSSNGRVKDAIDRSLRGKGYDDQILRFLEVARGCVASTPKERHTMYQVYTSLKSINEVHDFSDQYDEFPLVLGKNDPDHQE
ncbi:putative inactive receptor kinase [Acorus calamus]|uniref:Inactive receptor kinase n=1 Tax=Acorus calamus TaxID=4465 RepID=A0AAV9EUZ4_ACOCL|nr:putative inactive receptor kinase [Acorus calamus]